MKKTILILLILSLILSGCYRHVSLLKEPALFYYPRIEFDYGEEDGVIGVEERETAGHLDDLPYLLVMYFTEPVDESLYNPFPEDTEMTEVTKTGSRIIVQLSDTARSLSDSAFSLACTCLGLTCFELDGIEAVTVTSGLRTQTILKENILLVDNYLLED